MRVKNYNLLFVKETIYAKISIYKIFTRSSTSLSFPRPSDLFYNFKSETWETNSLVFHLWNNDPKDLSIIFSLGFLSLKWKVDRKICDKIHALESPSSSATVTSTKTRF